MVSFAAGIIACAAVSIALCLLPSRKGPGRQEDPPRQTAGEVQAPQVPGLARPDAGNQIIEEFFDSNVDLYQQIANTR